MTEVVAAEMLKFILWLSVAFGFILLSGLFVLTVYEYCARIAEEMDDEKS